MSSTMAAKPEKMIRLEHHGRQRFRRGSKDFVAEANAAMTSETIEGYDGGRALSPLHSSCEED